jgi:hypothetical protein
MKNEEIFCNTKYSEKTKFREFFWPVPISVPIDGYTGLFI